MCPSLGHAELSGHLNPTKHNLRLIVDDKKA